MVRIDDETRVVKLNCLGFRSRTKLNKTRGKFLSNSIGCVCLYKVHFLPTTIKEVCAKDGRQKKKLKIKNKKRNEEIK